MCECTNIPYELLEIFMHWHWYIVILLLSFSSLSFSLLSLFPFMDHSHLSSLSPCRDTHTHTEGWSLLYLLYWHLWPCIFILLTSVYYIKWAFTSIILNIIDQEIMDNVWHQSSHQATFLAINIAFQYVGIKWSRPKIGPIKFWSWSQVSLQ